MTSTNLLGPFYHTHDSEGAKLTPTIPKHEVNTPQQHKPIELFFGVFAPHLTTVRFIIAQNTGGMINACLVLRHETEGIDS